jgi:hypothetical protein
MALLLNATDVRVVEQAVNKLIGEEKNAMATKLDGWDSSMKMWAEELTFDLQKCAAVKQYDSWALHLFQDTE